MTMFERAVIYLLTMINFEILVLLARFLHD